MSTLPLRSGSSCPDGLRLAYADPPYPGMAKRRYGDHADYAGEVDHADLIARLEDEFVDLFPGSGAVARAWDDFTRQEALNVA